LWYAASSFDFEPIVNFETGKVPDELGAVLKSNPLYIMTDYSVKFTNAIKGIYSNFDRESFDLSHYDGIYGKYRGIEIEQMIPLTLFNKTQLIEMRQKYSKGKLWKAIEKSSVPSLKPKYWIADDCSELRPILREINPHERGFYGQPHYFRTKW
jgi:hypothetical protein